MAFDFLLAAIALLTALGAAAWIVLH